MQGCDKRSAKSSKEIEKEEEGDDDDGGNLDVDWTWGGMRGTI